MKKFLSVSLSLALLFGTTGCSVQNATNTQKGAVIGSAGGAAVGASIGALIGGGKGALIGGVLGTAAGTTAGILIGKKMDKQKAELEKIEGAQVETVTDTNNLQAIKITFDSGILFGFNKSDLSANAKQSLSEFAQSLKNNPSTDVTIYGYTDNVGSLEANKKVSNQRALTVQQYLMESGVPTNRMTAQGLAWENPVASNDSEAGRAQNRRVEIYITANQEMVNQANAGTLR
ncbi:MAG: OmpA family protein [Muribaculaceae bacterium]|nr:OmpA family protein [Muribaculaceae bacterium]